MANGGTGNPEGDPQSGAPGSSENSIPHNRVVEMVQKGKDDARAEARRESDEHYETLLATERQGRADAEAKATARPEPKSIGRDELAAMVESGKITQEQMEGELTRQRETKLDERVDERVDAAVKQREVLVKVDAEYQAYVAALPDITSRSSDNFKRAGVEMQKLLGEGHPNDLRTEVLAMRMAFGAVAGLTRNAADRETHEDGAGGGGVADEGAGAGEGDGIPTAPKGLDARKKAYYDKEIVRGIYSGWDDPQIVRQMKRIGVSA